MNKFKLGLVGLAVMVTVVGVHANAADNENSNTGLQADKEIGIECMPAKDFVKILGKLSQLKADKIDTVSMVPKMRFAVNDGGVLPERVFFRHMNTETPFQINTQGVVTDFIRIKDMQKDGEMCLQDKTRIGLGENDEGLELNIDLNLAYHNTSGIHSLVELKDGLSDGRAHIKKIAPAMVRFMIPKFTHMSVATDEGQAVKISAYQNDQEISGLKITALEDRQMIEFAQFKSLGADSLHITGGTYTLGPTPSPKEMRSKD